MVIAFADELARNKTFYDLMCIETKDIKLKQDQHRKVHNKDEAENKIKNFTYDELILFKKITKEIMKETFEKIYIPAVKKLDVLQIINYERCVIDYKDIISSKTSVIEDEDFSYAIKYFAQMFGNFIGIFNSNCLQSAFLSSILNYNIVKKFKFYDMIRSYELDKEIYGLNNFVQDEDLIPLISMFDLSMKLSTHLGIKVDLKEFESSFYDYLGDGNQETEKSIVKNYYLYYNEHTNFIDHIKKKIIEEFAFLGNYIHYELELFAKSWKTSALITVTVSFKINESYEKLSFVIPEIQELYSDSLLKLLRRISGSIIGELRFRLPSELIFNQKRITIPEKKDENADTETV